MKHGCRCFSDAMATIEILLRAEACHVIATGIYGDPKNIIIDDDVLDKFFELYEEEWGITGHLEYTEGCEEDARF